MSQSRIPGISQIASIFSPPQMPSAPQAPSLPDPTKIYDQSIQEQAQQQAQGRSSDIYTSPSGVNTGNAPVYNASKTLLGN